MSEYNVMVPLPKEAPVPTEALRARHIEADLYEIIAAPFVAYDIHCGDQVRVKEEADQLIYQEHVRAGGHATARALFSEDADFMAKTKALMSLKSMGLRAEDPKGRYYTMDVPPRVDVEELADALDALEEQGVLEYELLSPA